MYETIYEYLASKKCAFGEYLQLMADFIKGLKDVKHLINCGVIKNEFCTYNYVFQMWNNLQSEIPLPLCSKAYEDMVSKINKQCKSLLSLVLIKCHPIFHLNKNICIANVRMVYFILHIHLYFASCFDNVYIILINHTQYSKWKCLGKIICSMFS